MTGPPDDRLWRPARDLPSLVLATAVLLGLVKSIDQPGFELGIAGTEVGLDGGPRDEADAVAGGDGALHRLLQPELEPQVEVAEPGADPAQLVLDHLTHARALLHGDQRLLAKLVERDRAAGEAVARRADEDDLIPEERLEDDGAVAARGPDDPELELAAGDRLDDRLGVGDVQLDDERSVQALELAEEKRHDGAAGSARGTDRERAPELTVGFAGDVLDELLLKRKQPLGAAVEPQPRLRRLDATAGAVEQPLPEALLERADLEADRGLRDPEPLGRAGEALPLDDGAEGGKLPRVHKD